jgi:protein-S-isoprenylcysteine O-methyltransferase Ste14
MSNARLVYTRLILIPVVGLALVSHHVYHEGGVWDQLLAAAGLVLLLAAMGGRIWANAHLAGRKDRELVRTGPYSISRNPLYFFSLVGFAGAGLAFESVALALLFVGVFFATHWAAVRREEEKLEGLFGEEYRAYRARVPLFLPRLSLHRAGGDLALDPRRFTTGLRDCLAIPLVFLVAQGLEAAKVSGLLPVLLELP